MIVIPINNIHDGLVGTLPQRVWKNAVRAHYDNDSFKLLLWTKTGY